jgi:hypothetical protein
MLTTSLSAIKDLNESELKELLNLFEFKHSTYAKPGKDLPYSWKGFKCEFIELSKSKEIVKEMEERVMNLTFNESSPANIASNKECILNFDKILELKDVMKKTLYGSSVLDYFKNTCDLSLYSECSDFLRIYFNQFGLSFESVEKLKLELISFGDLVLIKK